MPAAVEQMLYNKRETPWHKEGVPITGLATAEQCLELGGLNFTVEKQPLFINGRDGGDKVKLGNHMATIRTDRHEVLGVVGAEYEVLQNAQAFSFFDEIVGAGKAIYETAGSLHSGKKVWLLAKLPEQIRVAGDDVIEQYLLLSNGHDGNTALQYGFTPVRVVCQNTLSMAISNERAFTTIHHTQGMQKRLIDAGAILRAAHDCYAQAGEAFQAFRAKSLSDKQAERYFRHCFANEFVKRTDQQWDGLETLKRLYVEGQGQDLPGVRGTLWAAYNAVTEFEDYGRNLRKATSRIGRNWFGQGCQNKIGAFRVASRAVRTGFLDEEVAAN